MNTERFEPGPLRAAVLVAVLFLALPGSGEGAALLWTFAGGSSPVPLVAPATHGMLQLGGGFMILIQAFLALGVPHLLGLNARRARAIVVPIAVIAAGLCVTVAAEITGNAYAVVVGRALCLAGAVLGAGVFLVAHERGRGLRALPVPVLIFALCVQPGGWLLFLLEATGHLPSGVSGEVLLMLVVVPVVMGMGWKMFSAMLQLEPAKAATFVVAIVCWIAGALLDVGARLGPVSFCATRTARVAGAALLFTGAVAWLLSVHGLRRRRGRLMLQTAAGPELRWAVATAAACLCVAPLVSLVAALTDRLVLVDVARHLIAIGFVLCTTMGVTLRALPRFCRGRESSSPLALVTLALVVLGLALRFARVLPGGEPLVRAAALLMLAGVVLWGGHLMRGLVPVEPS